CCRPCPPPHTPSFPTRRSSGLPAVHNAKQSKIFCTGWRREFGHFLFEQRCFFLENSIFVECDMRHVFRGCEVIAELVFPEIRIRSEEHTSELQSRDNLVCRLLL